MDEAAHSAQPRTIGSAEIQNLIPHRHPFLFVDSVDILEGGKKAVGTKCVSANEPVFQGHFPGRPILPGVLALEALAQTACVALACQGGLQSRLAMFLGIEEAKFRLPILPGSTLKLHVEILKLGSRAGKLRGEARLDEKVAAEATMTFAFVEK
ncbi:MAG: 3-hydroxyacyl-ACP dehydratase FabZ [Elusimicrobia bacterium]|nr:3-hydroxyacyl-ACP dehydratase FabZ [Elusimicrobiota bacterium]